jgi:hypothetical protein
MHLIYSKLKSANVMGGKIEKGLKPFTIEFKPDVKTQVPDNQYDALMKEPGSVLRHLLNCGDFVGDAESATAEISSLKGELKKVQLALKKAEDAAKQAEIETGVKNAENALIEAEDALESAADGDAKKKAMKVVKEAKSVLVNAQKAK